MKKNAYNYRYSHDIKGHIKVTLVSLHKTLK